MFGTANEKHKNNLFNIQEMLSFLSVFLDTRGLLLVLINSAVDFPIQLRLIGYCRIFL